VENKKIAALAGVLHYLREKQEEQERTALTGEPQNRKSPGLQESRALKVSAWSLYGRQTTMQMRALIQRRVLRR